MKGIPFEFSDCTLVIPPLSLGAMEQLQGRLETMDEASITPEYIGTVVDSVYAALQRNYPDMTREEVAALLDLQNMQEVMDGDPDPRDSADQFARNGGLSHVKTA